MLNALKPMKIKFPICIFEIWSILYSKFRKFTKMTTLLNFAHNYIKIHSRSSSYPTPGALCPGQYWCSTFLNQVHKIVPHSP